MQRWLWNGLQNYSLLTVWEIQAHAFLMGGRGEEMCSKAKQFILCPSALASPSPPWSCCRWSAASAGWSRLGCRTPPGACPPDGTRSPEKRSTRAIRQTKEGWLMATWGIYIGPGTCSHPSARLQPIWRRRTGEILPPCWVADEAFWLFRHLEIDLRARQ